MAQLRNNRKFIFRIYFISERVFEFFCLALSYLFPRDNNIWIFGGHQGTFSDNTKYFFLYVAENYPKIKSIWITKNKALVKDLRSRGLEAYYQMSFKGVFYSLRAKVYIFHSHLYDINLSTSSGTIKVNLWHGIPIKRVRFSSLKKGNLESKFVSSFRNKFTYPQFFIKSDFILSTSKRVTKYFSEAFRLKEKAFLEFGYPRNEILNYREDTILDFIKKYEPIASKKLIYDLASYKKVFIYMPTWRDNGRDFVQSAGFDFEKLNTVLQDKNYLLLLKLHPYTTIEINLDRYKHIMLLQNNIDIYPILPFTDCLITDYSSVYFDYHLMNKEIILFPFDKDEYIDKDREMYYDYSQVIDKELVVLSFDELIDAIKFDKVSSGIKNQLIQEMVLETKSIPSSKRIVEFLLDFLS